MTAGQNRICLWFNHNGEEAARFYEATVPDSRVETIVSAPGDYPAGKKGDPLTILMTLAGIPAILLNAGPQFPQSEAFSIQLSTPDQAETDRLWDALIEGGGSHGACGWLRDRFGLNWQVTPARLTELIGADGETAGKAFAAMMTMSRIDIAALEEAVAVAA